MKDILIVYFSLEGNTDYAAKVIAEKTGADMLRLMPEKEYHDKGFMKFLWGGKSAVMGEKPKLKPYEEDLPEYSKVVLGFPVWASNFTPPLRTFIEENRAELRNKDISAFACEGGSGGEKALRKLVECIGIDGFSETAIFIDPLARKSEESERDIKDFCRRLGNGGE